jgi:hypothetical protein
MSNIKAKVNVGVAYDGKSLKAAIDSIARRSTTLREDVARALIGCVLHATEYGNVTPGTQLIEAMGSAMRTNAAKQWLIDFGPFMWVEDGETKKKGFKLDPDKAKKCKEKMASDLVSFIKDMTATPYFEYIPEPEFKPFNFKAALASLVATAEKRAKKQDGRDNFEGVDDVRAFIAAKMMTAEEVVFKPDF